MAAPGDDIYSTYLGGGYKFLSGTSMAAPYAAGLAAMLKSRNPARPTRPAQRDPPKVDLPPAFKARSPTTAGSTPRKALNAIGAIVD